MAIHPFQNFMVRYGGSERIFTEGDLGTTMYIVHSGKVRLFRMVEGQKRSHGVMEKGDFFGEMSILERLPRSATAEMIEDGDLIVFSGETFGDMIKANPEIAIRMLRKYSIRLRETNNQVELMVQRLGGVEPTAMPFEAPSAPPGTASTLQAEALAFFVSPTTGNVFPVFKSDALLGRFDSVTGTSPEIDLTNEDQSRNISRRHARLVIKDDQFFIAEEIGTMNGTFLNGGRLSNGVLTPISDGDELMLCRLALTFKLPES
jgi:CRP-like cAMP-binding protein